MRNSRRFLHGIARSAATLQSVLLAAHQRRKQYFGRIRKRLRIRPKAHLSLPFPAGMRIATPVCALVRNDMQKTGTRQRVQGGASKQTGRRLRVLPLGERPCKRWHAANFSMSLRGAQRRGNPFSLQHSIAESSTLGEYEKYYEFALGSTSLQTLTRSKFQHVIARSAATWQSVLLAAQHHRKQYFRRIRKNATNSP